MRHPDTIDYCVVDRRYSADHARGSDVRVRGRAREVAVNATIIRTDMLPELQRCFRQLRTENFRVSSVIVDPTDIGDVIAEACERFPELPREVPDERGYRVSLTMDGVPFYIRAGVPSLCGIVASDYCRPGTIEVQAVWNARTSTMWPEYRSLGVVVRCAQHSDCIDDHDIGRACLADTRRRA